MKKLRSIAYFVGTVIPMLFSSCGDRKPNNTTKEDGSPAEKLVLYNLEVPSLTGDSVIQLNRYKGKKILIVNVASKCGYTYQYEGLEKLYQTYSDKLVVIGFPCNQFLGQEPGKADEIAKFCSLNYGVSFPLTQKIEVKGKNQHPVYTWLTSQYHNDFGDFSVSWNFNKFLIDENGKLIAYFGSKTKPMSEDITRLL